jgi:hypothetical protein
MVPTENFTPYRNVDGSSGSLSTIFELCGVHSVR